MDERALTYVRIALAQRAPAIHDFAIFYVASLCISVLRPDYHRHNNSVIVGTPPGPSQTGLSNSSPKLASKSFSFHSPLVLTTPSTLLCDKAVGTTSATTSTTLPLHLEVESWQKANRQIQAPCSCASFPRSLLSLASFKFVMVAPQCLRK